jgi:hypothetical protein
MSPYISAHFLWRGVGNPWDGGVARLQAARMARLLG